jgi:hypothetical protein
VGGSGPKRTLRTAARYADAVNLWGPPEMVRQTLEVLKDHCRDLGRDFSQIRVTVFLPIMDNVESAKGIIGHLVEGGFDDFIVSPFARPNIELIRRFMREVIPAFQ